MHNKLKTGKEAIQKAIQEYSPDAIFAGFSGGDDSLMATHFLHQHFDRAKTAFIDTGIGLRTTRCFVEDICADHGWDLETYHAKYDAGQDYDEIVKGNEKIPGGFPGPAAHQPPNSYIYDRLKGRCVAKLHRDWKAERGGKVLLVSGIRAEESERRMGYDDSVVDQDAGSPGVIWVNPIFDITAEERQQYIERHGLRRNPASKLIGSSGECLCMANDEHGKRMKQLYHNCLLLTQRTPYDVNEMEVYFRLVELWKEVRDRYPWAPDMRPPDWFDEAEDGQLAFNGLPGVEDQNRVAHMCVGCGKNS